MHEDLLLLAADQTLIAEHDPLVPAKFLVVLELPSVEVWWMFTLV